MHWRNALTVGIKSQNVNWIIDADISSFFDEIDHDWMLKFLEHRIADRRMLGLIRKWLKAGVIEDGCRVAALKGTPQGAVISPLLANIYLHYALDLWTRQWRRKFARGNVIVVRYADDSVYGFKSEETARRFLTAMQETGQIRADPEREEDAADRVWSICCNHSQTKGPKQA
jgi:retron-type reverse transcriptase